MEAFPIGFYPRPRPACCRAAVEPTGTQHVCVGHARAQRPEVEGRDVCPHAIAIQAMRRGPSGCCLLLRIRACLAPLQ